jgi:hypothetical protein
VSTKSVTRHVQMRRALATICLFSLTLWSDVCVASVMIPSAIDRLYQHIWKDQLEAIPGDLVLGRRNPSARAAKTDVTEFYVAIFAGVEAPYKLGPLEASFVIAEAKPLSAQLRDFEHLKLAEIDKLRDPNVTYWPLSIDPILKLLRLRSGRLKERDCPAIRELVGTYADYTPKIALEINPFQPDVMTGPVYYLRSFGADGELSLNLDGSSKSAEWIRSALLKIEACLRNSEKSDKP